jgi:hypothetical protein
MRDWLRSRLEDWGGRRNKRDEELAELLNRHVDALTDRRTRRIYLTILAVSNSLIWLSVLIFPKDIRRAWVTVTELDEKIGTVTIAIILGLGMCFIYILFRLKFPDLENPRFDDTVLTSYSYSLHSVKRWRIWLISVIGGVVNVLLLVIAALCLDTGN